MKMMLEAQQAQPSLTLTILGSAAIGALVSSLITALSQWRERSSRKRELLVSKSIEMAHKWTDNSMRILEHTGKSGDLYPDVVLARWYHRQLTRLFNEGKIADDLEEDFSDFINISHRELQKTETKERT
jgi:hypothetical protein